MADNWIPRSRAAVTEEPDEFQSELCEIVDTQASIISYAVIILGFALVFGPDAALSTQQLIGLSIVWYAVISLFQRRGFNQQLPPLNTVESTVDAKENQESKTTQDTGGGY